MKGTYREIRVIYDALYRPMGIEVPTVNGEFVLALRDEAGLYEHDFVQRTWSKQQALMVCAYMTEINRLLRIVPGAEPLDGGYWVGEDVSPKRKYALAAGDALVCHINKDGLLKVRRIL